MRVSPYLLLTLANLFWAGNWVISRGMRADVPPLALSFWRWVVALLCLLPFAWPYLQRDWPALRTAWRPIALLGLLGMALYNVLTYAGLQQTEAINGVLLNSFIPVVIVALAWVFQGKRLRLPEIIGMTASFIGVLAIVTRGDPLSLLRLSLNFGDLLILVSVFVWAVYTLLLPKRPAVHPFALLFACASVGLIFLAPLYLLELSGGRQIAATPQAWLTILYTGIFPALLGFIFWNKGVEQVGAARAGYFIHLLPAFGILLAALFLGERLFAFHLIGITLIFGGIFLTTRR
jgi:drug/metabolite transporter (DMT)-like permease